MPAVGVARARRLEHAVRELIEESEHARDVVTRKERQRRQSKAFLRVCIANRAKKQTDHRATQDTEYDVLLDVSAVGHAHQ